MTASTAPTARSAWRSAGLVAAAALLVVLFLRTGTGRPIGEFVVFALGLSAVPVALRRHRTPAVIAWRGLGTLLVCFALSGVAELVATLGVAPRTFDFIEAALDLAAYAALVVAALGQLAVGRRRRDRAAWVDTSSLLIAAGVAVLAVTDGAQGLGDLGIGTPVIATVVLLVCVPLAVTDNGRSVAAMAMLAAGLLTIVGYGARLGATPDDWGVLTDLPLFAVAALALAGRHPSIATLGGRASARSAVATGRLVGLGAALLVSPAVLLLWSLRDGGVGYAVGAGSMLLTAMALWRLAAINRDRETTRRALVASESRLQLLLENAADVIAIIDTRGSVAYMSPAVQSLLGRPPADYLGRNAIELADPRDQARLRAAVTEAGEAGSVVDGYVDTDIRMEHSSGGTRWVEMRISGKVDAVGIEGWVVNFREVTDRKLFEDELRRQATTDPLTGLLNRTAFADRLAAATAAVDPERPPAVLFVDLDDFKAVNDSLGHAAGDELLTTVAARLSADVRGEDVVARLGGDEFAVLLADASGERLREVADRLLVSLRRPLEVVGTTVAVTASIGGALGVVGDDAEQLLARADAAMYRAKRAGKNSRALTSV